MGVVVLKRLADALADGDNIEAVIKGSAINNDGALKVGYTAPSVNGQAEAIVMAQALAGIEPRTIGYVEAHGTGTPLGDPIEIAALTQAFRASTDDVGFCAIGAVKTNIGHLDAAAGVAGLIKTVLSLKHRQLLPSLHFETPNPRIDFAHSPFYVNATLSDWPAGTTPRRAGVSSFGIGGTNAHVVLEEAPPAPPASPSRTQHLVVLSAKTNTALEVATDNLVAHLRQHPEICLADVAYTCQVGRRAFEHRRMIVCDEVSAALSALETRDPQRVFTALEEPRTRPVVFLFPGQGAQYERMGADLYRDEPIFRQQVEHCARLLEPHLGLDLRTVLYGSEATDTCTGELSLHQTGLAQPCLFVVEYALARLWMQWGVHPQAMLGHSLGEYVAACLANVMSLEDALALVALRGQLMQQLPQGAMLAVPLAEQYLYPLLDAHLALAAVNGPGHCVVSGPPDAVAGLHARLSKRGVACQRLQTSHAFHSAMMEPIVASFAQAVERIELKAPQLPYVSSLSGQWITATEATDANYWARQLRQTVRFATGLQQVLEEPDLVVLEVGPGHALSALAKRHPARREGHVILASLPRAGNRQGEAVCLQQALGQMWLAGGKVEWPQLYDGQQRTRLPLPTYPFERQRYWIEQPTLPTFRSMATGKQLPEHKRAEMADWFYIPSWKRSAPPQPSQGEQVRDDRSCWLVMADECGVGTHLVRRLEREGRNVTVVRAGSQFARLDDGTYTLDPQEPAGYEVLLNECHALKRVPTRIIHLWSITAGDDWEERQDRSALPDLETYQNLSFYSLLFLAQALGNHYTGNPLRIELVSNNLQEVTGEEVLRPEKAILLGPCKVIPQEYPNITCRSIDVVLPQPGTWQEDRLTSQLMAEFAAPPADPVIAYRGNYRWVRTFEPLRLQGTAKDPPKLRKGGVYLITGGLGGIGATLAKYLVQRVQARLVLVGRSVLPEREQWAEWLAVHGEQDAMSSKIRRMQALEAAGAEVLVVSADVANEEQMRIALVQARERFGGIDGVIHAAGGAGEGMIQLKKPAEAARVLSPRVRGTQVLEAVLKNTPPDFLVLCSSLRSILGGIGQVDYCAANAFLDACATRNGLGPKTHTISINWDSWKDAGMSVEAVERLHLNPEEELKEGISSAEGAEVFSRVLCDTLPQVVVSTLGLRAPVQPPYIPETLGSSGKAEQFLSSRPAHPRPQLKEPYVAPRNKLEQTLAEIWQSLLGIEQIGVYDNFFELGGDSVIGIQIITRINEAGLHLTPKQVFEHQTIAELAALDDTSEAVQAEQGIVTGEVPLTPIQHWFFEQTPPNPHHWNQAALLEGRQVLNPALLQQAMQKLLTHHDALRLRFTQLEAGWQQVNAGLGESLPFTHIDLSLLPEQERGAFLERVAAEAQVSLNLSQGPLLRVIFFDSGRREPGHLLVVIHHLAIDVVSWRILLEDLETAYQQLSRGEPIKLPPKTASFKKWAERISEYAQSESLRSELHYWLALPWTRVVRLPRDYSREANTEASARTLTVTLSMEETRALLREVPAAYHIQVNEVLLTALFLAFSQWTGRRTLLIDLEGHGRETLFEKVDLSRTVGWFTTIFPVLLDLPDTNSAEHTLKMVKESLRGVPNRGIGYGVLRYLQRQTKASSELRAFPRAEVSFLYLGQADQHLTETSLFRPPKEVRMSARSSSGRRSYLLEINGFISNGQLQMDWIYSENVHRHATIESVARSFLAELRSLVVHCLAVQGGYTPSDFPKLKFSQAELDAFLEELSDSEEYGA